MFNQNSSSRLQHQLCELKLEERRVCADIRHLVKNNVRDSLTLVFDTQMFAYGEILSFMHSLKGMKIQLGTYNASTKVIITHKQIYK